jgi:hypothetical protein
MDGMTAQSLSTSVRVAERIERTRGAGQLEPRRAAPGTTASAPFTSIP